MGAVEHTRSTDHPLTTTYNGGGWPLAGQQARPHGVATGWEGRAVREVPIFQSSQDQREDEEAGAVTTQKPGTKSQI